MWLEKTPRHLYYIPNIAQALPQAKFIHLLRSGEDVVASLYEVTHAHPAVWGSERSVDSCISRWVKDTKLSLGYSGQANHLLVHYEALTENPEASLRRIFAFIGLPYSSAAQKSYRHAAERVTAPGEVWKNAAQRRISPPSHHKFTQLFTPEEQAYILRRTRFES